MKIGVTGSRAGANGLQLQALQETLTYLHDEYDAQELHHGDAVGVDAQAAGIAHELGYKIIGHPPDIDLHRAFYPSDEEREPLPYLLRDRNIVNETDLLIGCPGTRRRLRNSGTWYTIRYATKVGQKLIVIWPDGSVSTS